MRLSRYEKIFVAFIFLLFLFTVPPHFLAGSDDLRVEGIAYDGKNPQESIAVISGVALRPGDTYQGVTIVSISPDSVRISDPKLPGQKDLPLVGGVPLRPEVPQSKATASSGKADAKQAPSEKQPSKAVPSEKKKGWNPFEMFNMVKNVQVLHNLKQIHTAANVYWSQEEGGDRLLNLKVLAERRLIPSDLAGGELNGYRYTIRDTGNGVEAAADPVNDDPNATHYLFDDFGNLRQEVGRPATASSKRSGASEKVDEMQSKMQAMAEQAGALPPQES